MQNIEDFVELSNTESASVLENKANLLKESFAQEQLDNIKQDRFERKKYARWTFKFLCVFTGLVLLIVFLCATKGQILMFDFSKFHLSDAVLITLITSSLTSIVGIFIFVMKYLFKGK